MQTSSGPGEVRSTHEVHPTHEMHVGTNWAVGSRAIGIGPLTVSESIASVFPNFYINLFSGFTSPILAHFVLL